MLKCLILGLFLCATFESKIIGGGSSSAAPSSAAPTSSSSSSASSSAATQSVSTATTTQSISATTQSISATTQSTASTTQSTASTTQATTATTQPTTATTSTSSMSSSTSTIASSSPSSQTSGNITIASSTTTTAAPIAAITITGSHLNIYAGDVAFANGNAQSFVVIQSGAGSVSQNPISPPDTFGNTYSWTWTSSSVTNDTVILSTSSGASSILTLDVLILGDYPILTIDNPVVLLDNSNMYTNTGISRDPTGGSVTLSTTIGTLTQTKSAWSWSLNESNRNSATYVAITALTSGGNNYVIGYFFLQQSASVTANNIVYTLILGLPYGDFGSSDFNGVLAATGRVTSLDPSVISASYGSRRGLSTPKTNQQTIIQITLNNIPPAVANTIVSTIKQAIITSEYFNQMSNNYFNGNTLNSLTLSIPPVANNLQLSAAQGSTNQPLIPIWGFVIIAVVGFVLLLLVIFWILRTSKKHGCINDEEQDHIQTPMSYKKRSHQRLKYQQPLQEPDAYNESKSLISGETTQNFDSLQREASTTKGYKVSLFLQPINKTVTLFVNAHDSISKLKQRLFKVHPTLCKNANEFKFFYKGSEIQDDISLKPDFLQTSPIFTVTVEKSIVIYLNVQATEETIVFCVEQNLTIQKLKQRIVNERPDVSDKVENIQLLFSGKIMKNDLTIASSGMINSTTINVLVTSNLPKKETKILTQKDKISPSSLGDLLFALSKRNDQSMIVRKEARKIMMSSSINDFDAVNKALISLLEKDLISHVESLDVDESISWIPVEENENGESDAFDTVFAIGEAQKFQRTNNFTLIGPTKTDNCDNIQRGLVIPLNYKNGNLEGVNSIVWMAVAQAKTVVLKGMLPFSDSFGYEGIASTQDSEYKIPLSIPQHPNIIPILHQFIGSSALVYPWITQEVRDLNEQFFRSSGRRFVRRYTTYIVTPFYPSTLRQMLLEKKERGELMTERQLCFMALQLLSAVDHLKKHKISHRDIKDDNIFITSDGRLVLADFGCSISCYNMRYQHVNDLSAKSGAIYCTAPEVLEAIKKGPSFDMPVELWDILEKNDIYAIGSLIFKSLNLTIPSNNGYEYTDGEIPALPPHFSSTCNLFFQKFVSFNPKNRPSSEIAIQQLNLMLFGPSKESIKEVQKDNVDNWLLKRRLDLVFNTCEDDEGTICLGTSNERIPWPLAVGSVERDFATIFYKKSSQESFFYYIKS